MKMQKDCDLELRLFPTSSYDSDSDTSVVESRSSGNSQPKEESHRITIFYNGQMCVSSDVTHLQAKSIIWIASREIEERSFSNGSDPPNRSTRFHHQLPIPKASMRKSLQSFLEKRKNRIQAYSKPYHQHSRR
uniref:Protein TIFY n=1 Tax=Noccaea caerulescens TaxID=107243 RepID=A0A1J3E1Q4_NOCCA